MNKNNYKFRYDAYKNNTFDLDVLEKSLDESKMSGYQYLRQFQLDSTGYRRFDFKMQDIYKTCNVNHNVMLIPRRWVFFIDYEFINVGKRLTYKRSTFYEKDISFNEITKRPDLFDSTFLVFIDGKLYTNGINILCKEDKTYVIFYCKETPSPEGFSMQEMKHYIENNVDVTIYFIPNIGIKSIPTNAYRIRTLNKESGIPTRTLGLSDYVDYNNSLVYINPVGEIESIPTSVNLTDEGMYVDNSSVESIIKATPNNTALNIQLIPLRNLLTKIEINRTKWFEIPMQDYPVAVENCIIIDEDNNFVHSGKINHYYPNIYSIENVDELIEQKKLFIYVFYFDNKIDKLKHLDMLAAYHKYVPDYLDRYKNGSIPELVKDFIPNITQYNIKDYKRGLYRNEQSQSFYIKNNKNEIYEFKLINNTLYSNIYNETSIDSIPNYYYVQDNIANALYKIYLEDTELRIDVTEDNVEDEIIYVFDPITKDHNTTNNVVLAIFDHIQYTDHFKYKVVKMKEFIKSDVNNFRRYLKNLGLGNNYYYVDVSKIDLSKRKRVNNKDTKLNFVEFNKEMYMFVFRNDFRGMYDDIIIHVDGSRYNDEILVYKDTMLDYIYIPCDLVKSDSILEVEKISETKRDIVFKSDHKINMIKLDLGEVAYRNKTLFNDLFITDRSNGDYIPTSAYQLILPVTFHMDDIESDIVLDYIITETYPGYFQLVALNHGLIEIYNDEDLEEHDNAYYLSMQSKQKEFYQFDMSESNVSFNKVDYVNGYVINKIRAMDDKNLIYKFKSVNGTIQMEITEDDGTGIRLAEGGLNLIDIGDVFLPCPREIKLKIIDSKYLNKDLTLHIRKDHCLSHVHDIMLESDNIKDNFTPLTIHTDSKKDYRYFRIYQNGRLVPRHLGVINPDTLNIGTTIEIYPGFIREPDTDYKITLETMPYMMKQVCYLKTIPRDKIINLKGMIDKPFDFKWYDIYVNGKKLVKNEVEIISANMIKLLKTDSLKNLEIIENSRDKEYFGCFDGVYDIIDELFENDKTFADNVNNSVKENTNIRDIETSIVEIPLTPLDFIVRKYYDYIKAKFGFINPDELQISRQDVQQFNLLIDENKPFVIGLDAYGFNRNDMSVALPINPDE